jgi:diguanylate cyclase (GGDEF)-like protein
VKTLSPAEIAQRTLSALAAKGLPPTAPNYLSQFKEITGNDTPDPAGAAVGSQTEQILMLMGTLMDAVRQASSSLQEELTVFSAQSREMIAQVALHTDPDAANEMFHALSASASWLLGQVSTTRRELSNTKSQLAVVRDELAKTQDLAISDTLTGLPNRRGLEFALNHELARARRNNLPLCVAFIDLDHFGRVNDLHGHAAGDVVLRHVAALIKQKLRTSDVFARCGGKAFALVLPETQNSGGEIVVSRLIDSLKRTPAIWDDGLISVSASAGVTQWFPGESAEALLERADQALYSAKHGESGRVVCAAIPQIIAPSGPEAK